MQQHDPSGYGQGYGAPQLPAHYAPPPGAGAAPHDPNKITPSDILVPLVLSVLCGIGGYGWGLVRLAQGHQKPGLVAIGVNFGLWVVGLGLWFLGALIMGIVAGGVSAAP